MDKILTFFALVCLLSFAFVGGFNGTTAMAQARYTFDAANTAGLIGTQVKNRAGETLGFISYFVFDSKDRPAVVILYQGDLQDLDVARHVAVPFTALEILGREPSQMSVVLNLRKEELLSAPRFNRTEDLKNLGDMKWIAGVYRYFGQQPYWTD